MTKDGHYGVVSNTKNPIEKGSIPDLTSHSSQVSHTDASVLFATPVNNSRNSNNNINSMIEYNDNIGANSSFGP